MKFFTPELIARGQAQDDQILNDVERLWDEACVRYRAHLDSLRESLPPGLRDMEEHYYLHDARIQGMGQRDHEFLIVLQLDTPPHTLLTFTYDLVKDPAINPASSPDWSPQDAVSWEYDEIERSSEDPLTWKQAILLSNGWEVQVAFRDVKIQEARALLPIPQTGLAIPFPQPA